jgi:hypothetical protein
LAITITQLLKAKKVVAVAVGKDYATVCKNITEGNSGPMNLGAFLQSHADACLYMDKESAHLLKGQLAPGQVATAAAQGRGFQIRTFRPGQGWVDQPMEFGRGRNIGSGQMDPMAKRRLMLEKKKQAALAGRK